MSDEREFLECEIADAMESDEDCRLEVALIIKARRERDKALAQLAQRDGELEALRARNEDLGDIVRTVLAWVKDEAVGNENGATGYRRAAWDVRRIILNCDFLALSDNQDRDAQTEPCRHEKWYETGFGAVNVCVRCGTTLPDDWSGPVDQESPALTDKEA